jgi:plastocyanin
MKIRSTILCVFSSLAGAALAAIQVPGANGTSGVLNITENTTIDLSLAANGAWDAANTANGIYDASQWAVVFNYSSVNIAAGATLTFTNHPSKAPVVWLVSGNVTIAGTVSLSGQSSVLAPLLAEPGPGGFRGGVGYFSVGAADGAGFGPGGGFRQANGGTYGTGTAAYGNPSLIPLIGGSGGAGAARNNATGGAAGGGAILIAATGTVHLPGTLRANGGDGAAYYFSDRAGPGSGGGIRIICDSLTGGGVVNAIPGLGTAGGTMGRVRIERAASTSTANIVPDPSIVPLAADATALLWPPSSAPEVRVVSIGGVAAPEDPRAAFGASGADVALPETTTTAVLIETTNVEQASTVQVRLTPRSNANATVVNATVESVVSTSPLVVRWVADVPVNTGYSAVQVRVVRP